jgi:hypothetical protein
MEFRDQQGINPDEDEKKNAEGGMERGTGGDDSDTM